MSQLALPPVRGEDLSEAEATYGFPPGALTLVDRVSMSGPMERAAFLSASMVDKYICPNLMPLNSTLLTLSPLLLLPWDTTTSPWRERSAFDVPEEALPDTV